MLLVSFNAPYDPGQLDKTGTLRTWKQTTGKFCPHAQPFSSRIWRTKVLQLCLHWAHNSWPMFLLTFRSFHFKSLPQALLRFLLSESWRPGTFSPSDARRSLFFGLSISCTSYGGTDHRNPTWHLLTTTGWDRVSWSKACNCRLLQPHPNAVQIMVKSVIEKQVFES